MVFAVADLNGDIVGLFRMPDATVFSIDVAVAKARNVAYYNSSLLVAADKPNDPIDPTTTPNLTAYTSRTFRYLASSRYPTGTAVGIPPGAFSSLLAAGINSANAENLTTAMPFSAYSTNTTPELMFDSFNVGRNFRDPRIAGSPNQNGVVFFPGSSGLYSGNTLLGGLGVSGDGVDQDDVVTTAASLAYAAPPALRADMYFIRNVRLPYSKFNRNPLL
ncbi:MAG: heme-binding protein [Pirellulales bacterium]